MSIGKIVRPVGPRRGQIVEAILVDDGLPIEDPLCHGDADDSREIDDQTQVRAYAPARVNGSTANDEINGCEEEVEDFNAELLVKSVSGEHAGGAWEGHTAGKAATQ